MGVVGSLPLSSSSLSVTDHNDIQNEHIFPSSNESNNEAMSVIPDVINNNQIKSCDYQRLYETMIHGHLYVRKYPLVASRLETRCCSKHRAQEGEKVMKRKLQCKKTRETTRKLNLKCVNIREQLEKQVQQLELKQNDLLLKVGKLRSHRQQLEVIYQQIKGNHKLID